MFGSCARTGGPWIAIAILGVIAPASQAAWLGYKNETKAPMVVQTTVVVNNQIVRGKAHVLYPNEIAWDNIPAPGSRQISIYDPKANNKLIHQDTITIGNLDIFLSARMETPAQQPNKPAPQPVIKLLPTKAPVAPGVVPPPQPKANPGTQPPQKAPAQPTKPVQEQPKTTPQTGNSTGQN
ncbi:MAG: hypothetical protein ACJ8C4_11820 [Gemmataceae bacterium]